MITQLQRNEMIGTIGELAIRRGGHQRKIDLINFEIDRLRKQLRKDRKTSPSPQKTR